MQALPNVTFKCNAVRDIVANDDEYDGISYFKTLESFYGDAQWSGFINAVEKQVRNHEDYKHFLYIIKSVLGLDFCQVFSKIHDKVDATVEFNHGPIFTLYDICEIALMRFIKTGQRINTFRVANFVLDQHYEMKINGVMMAVTPHEAFHNGDIFVNIDQHIGDVNAYIAENHLYFTEEIKYKIHKYIQLCKENRSFDKGILDIEATSTYITA